MELGAFSNNLAVKHKRASKAFYAWLGFVETGSNIEQNPIVPRQNGKGIGFFQRMVEKNMLTFNPG